MTGQVPIVPIRTLMQHGYSVASGIIKKNDEAMTVFMAEWGDGALAIYGAPWQDDEEKDKILNMLRLLFAARQVRQYVMVGEVWTVERSGSREEALRGPKPSQCEGRQEKLFLLGVTHEETVVAHADLGHTRDGDRTVGDLEWDEQGTQIEGRMTQLLPDPNTPPPPKGTAQLLESMLGVAPQKFTKPH